MNGIQLEDVLKELKDPAPEPFTTIPENIAERARISISKMLELEKIAKDILNKYAQIQ